MNVSTRVLSLAGHCAAAAGAMMPWLPGVPGVRLGAGALISAHHAVVIVPVGAGWIVAAAAAAGAVAALAGLRALLAVAAAAELAVIVDFIVLEAIRRAPGDYVAVTVAAGCWLVLAGSLAGLILAVAGGRRGRAAERSVP